MSITDEKIVNLLDSFYSPISDNLGKFRSFCENDNVPLILRETESYLNTFLKIAKPNNILEIGTAHGYSACYFATTCEGAHITTIERAPHMYDYAVSNIKSLGLESRINLKFGDANGILDSLIKDNSPDARFDLIFIDAAKSHYRRFFDAAVRVCANNAIIISDDIWQRGVTVSEKYDCKAKHRTNGRRMNEFLSFLTHCPYLHTTLLDIGDGLALSVYKGNTCKE